MMKHRRPIRKWSIYIDGRRNILSIKSSNPLEKPEKTYVGLHELRTVKTRLRSQHPEHHSIYPRLRSSAPFSKRFISILVPTGIIAFPDMLSSRNLCQANLIVSLAL